MVMKILAIFCALSIPWILLSWGSVVFDRINFPITQDLLLLALNFYAIGLILGEIVSDRQEVTLDMICGALAVYLLLGVTGPSPIN